MILKMFQVDAFASALFEGNPAAVVLLDEPLPETLMQRIAAENNLSETAFVQATGEEFQLRWFTPEVEVALCGHATLATAHVLIEQNIVRPGESMRFQTKSGLLIAASSAAGIMLDFPLDSAHPVSEDPGVAQALGCAVVELFRGRDDYLAVLASASEVEQAQPDLARVSALGPRGIVITAPADSDQSLAAPLDFVSRGFFPAVGIDEDPVTGSAHTLITPYWVERLGRNGLFARQGGKRRGYLQCSVAGDRVEMTGQAVTFFSCTIDV